MEKEKRRKEVSALYLQGLCLGEVAQRLGISKATVSRDLAAVQEDWKAAALVPIDMQRAKELARLGRVEAEAWAAWEGSKRPRESSTREETEGKQTRVTARTEPAALDNRFLQTVLSAISRRCTLQGLDLQSEDVFEAESRQIVDVVLRVITGYLHVCGIDKEVMLMMADDLEAALGGSGSIPCENLYKLYKRMGGDSELPRAVEAPRKPMRPCAEGQGPITMD